MGTLNRRDFLSSAAASAAWGTLATTTLGIDDPPLIEGPIAISSANGLRATEKAVDMVNQGADTLDAVIAGVNIVELDPNDMSVGYGGLPNEEGIVELDSCVMHGPTCEAGAVAALRNIKTPSRVAQLVMQRTDHVMIVGEGALRFARAHGMKESNLLTDKARKAWLRWKENLSDKNDWVPAKQSGFGDARSEAKSDIPFTYGTITCSVLAPNGHMSGVTTTSGLSYKIPGRIGDSPIIGAGLYVDNEVGAAGATGRGEAVIKICGSHLVIEAMRQGKSPQQACLLAIKQIAATTKIPRLLRKDGKPNFDVKMYALSKTGQFGAASIWSGAEFAVHEGGRNRLEKCAFLYERKS